MTYKIEKPPIPLKENHGFFYVHLPLLRISAPNLIYMVPATLSNLEKISIKIFYFETLFCQQKSV